VSRKNQNWEILHNPLHDIWECRFESWKPGLAAALLRQHLKERFGLQESHACRSTLVSVISSSQLRTGADTIDDGVR